MSDHYETLGVPRDASPATIKAAYRRLASGLHPDRSRPEERAACEARMAEVNRAYHVLGDPERREHYDRTGSDSARPDIDSAALARLRSIFDTYLSQDQEHHGDLVAMFRNAVSGHILQQRQAIASAEGKIGQLERRRGRLAGGTVFAEIVAAKLLQHRQAIERARVDIAIDEAVIKLLEQYRDVAPPPAPVYATSTLGGLGAFGGFTRFSGT